MAAVVHARNFKSSVYACFSVVGMVKLHSPPLFLDYFSFKALDLGDFRGISKNKKCGERKRRMWRAAGFFRRGKC